MRPENTYSVKEYLIKFISESILMTLLYRTSIFRCMGNYTFFQSKLILWGIIVLCGIITLISTIKKWRNFFSVLLGTMIPLGIYTLFAYSNSFPLVIRISSFLIISLSLAYAILVSVCLSGSSLKRKLSYSYNGFKCFAGGISYIFIFLLLANNTFKMGLFLSPSTKAQKAVKYVSESYMLKENKETILCFDEEIWYDLPLKKKLNCCQTILNIEKQHLFIPIEINCFTSGLSEDTLAQYDDGTHSVVIDIDHLEKADPEYVLDSLAHEARHAYQHCLCRAFDNIPSEYTDLEIFEEIFGDIKDWRSEFANYSDGISDDDYSDYYNQSCEIDARNYAKERIPTYTSIIP